MVCRYTITITGNVSDEQLDDICDAAPFITEDTSSDEYRTTIWSEECEHIAKLDFVKTIWRLVGYMPIEIVEVITDDTIYAYGEELYNQTRETFLPESHFERMKNA